MEGSGTLEWRFKMRSSHCLLAAAAGIMLLTGSALADTVGGGRAGAYPDEGQAFVGAEFLSSIDDTNDWFVNPNVEFAFADESDLVALSCDFHYDLDTQGRLAAWVGAGPSVLIEDREFAGSDADLGVNLIAGFGAKHGKTRPYFQGKVIVADEPMAVVGVGVRF
jgi:hypothetical protein